MRHVDDDERRARLAVRHALHPDHRVPTPEAATAAMTVLHATDAATVHLSCWARVDGLRVADVVRALETDRTLVKQLAMRRTLFVVPRDLLAAVWPSASARVAASERRAMAADVEKAGMARNGDAWLDGVRAAALAVITSDPEGLGVADVRRAAPALDVKVGVNAWSASRVVGHLGLTADVVRGVNTGHWRTSRPRWTTTAAWLGEVPAPWSAADGYRELVARWLRTFGPGTETDLVWWLGSTKAVVRAALAELGAVAVTLDGGGTGWLLPDDVEEVRDPGRWVALLPVLDPTVMGWKERAFSLGPHAGALTDRAGNITTTAWVDGRVVGCWVQDDDGTVEVRLLQPVPARRRAQLDREAARLTAWFDGVRIANVFAAPATLVPGRTSTAQQLKRL